MTLSSTGSFSAPDVRIYYSYLTATTGNIHILTSVADTPFSYLVQANTYALKNNIKLFKLLFILEYLLYLLLIIYYS